MPMIQIPQEPSRSDIKATERPSGENVAPKSWLGLFVRFTRRAAGGRHDVDIPIACRSRLIKQIPAEAVAADVIGLIAEPIGLCAVIGGDGPDAALAALGPIIAAGVGNAPVVHPSRIAPEYVSITDLYEGWLLLLGQIPLHVNSFLAVRNCGGEGSAFPRRRPTRVGVFRMHSDDALAAAIAGGDEHVVTPTA